MYALHNKKECLQAFLGCLMLAGMVGCSGDPDNTEPDATPTTPILETWEGENGPVNLANNTHTAQSVAFTSVDLADDFWSARQKQFICVTIMAGIENVEAPGGGISNIINAAKMQRGESYGAHEGEMYVDSDVHKLVEAMCYALQMDPRGDVEIMQAQVTIRNKLEEWIPYYQDAQEDDGYFDTYFTLAHPPEKWTNFEKHELYCMGHFYEAAVAHYRMTDGRDTRLLDMAIKNANYVESLFGPVKWKQVPGHQEIELVLLKLAGLCREIGVQNGVDYAANADRYVALAHFFLDTRGDHEGRHGISFWPEGCQDVLPVTEQKTALNHAVRAQYMYTAMADAMIQSGSDLYNEVLLALWDSVNTKTYAHGGVGVSDHHEGFGPDYYMPLDKAYCESCSSVANIMWNQRMNLLFGDSRYADKMEHVLYNAMLSGINLDGDLFFYTNVVTTAGRERVQWFGTACCPPNLMRTILSLGGYIYVRKGDEIRMNLFIGNEADLTVSDGDLKLKVETEFPWEGNVKVTVETEDTRNMALRLRVPSWATGANTVTVNGTQYAVAADADGYLTLNRTWENGDTVEVNFPMEVQQIPMVEGVEETENDTAFRRGPIVYTAESIDNEAAPKLYYISGDAAFTTEWVENLDGKEDPYGLRGLLKITTNDAMAHLLGGDKQLPLTLIPYYANSNRGAVPMELYISTVPREQPLEFYATPSASYTFDGNETDSPFNLNDGSENGNSRWTSYTGPLKPWVEYTFDGEVSIRGCQVMWYDDGGGVQVPNGLTIEYWDGEKYVPVNPTSSYTYFPKNQYGMYMFDTVITSRIRMTIDNSKTHRAAGIVEWKLLGL